MFALSFLGVTYGFPVHVNLYSNIPEEVIYFTERIENYKLLFFGTFIVNSFSNGIFMSRDTKRSAGFLIVIGRYLLDIG